MSRSRSRSWSRPGSRSSSRSRSRSRSRPLFRSRSRPLFGSRSRLRFRSSSIYYRWFGNPLFIGGWARRTNAVWLDGFGFWCCSAAAGRTKWFRSRWPGSIQHEGLNSRRFARLTQKRISTKEDRSFKCNTFKFKCIEFWHIKRKFAHLFIINI